MNKYCQIRFHRTSPYQPKMELVLVIDPVKGASLHGVHGQVDNETMVQLDHNMAIERQGAHHFTRIRVNPGSELVMPFVNGHLVLIDAGDGHRSRELHFLGCGNGFSGMFLESEQTAKDLDLGGKIRNIITGTGATLPIRMKRCLIDTILPDTHKTKEEIYAAAMSLYNESLGKGTTSIMNHTDPHFDNRIEVLNEIIAASAQIDSTSEWRFSNSSRRKILRMIDSALEK